MPRLPHVTPPRSAPVSAQAPAELPRRLPVFRSEILVCFFSRSKTMYHSYPSFASLQHYHGYSDVETDSEEVRLASLSGKTVLRHDNRIICESEIHP